MGRTATPKNPTRPNTAKQMPRPRKQQQPAAKSMMANRLNIDAFRANDPFPPMIRRSFKYSDLHQISTGTAGVYGSEIRYNMNGLYDPYYTGAGHQPYGFDQVFNIYNKYRVERASYRVSFTTPGAANDVLCTASISPGTSASLAGLAPATPIEWPNSTHGHLSTTGTRLCVLSGTIDLHTLVGVTKSRYDADDTFCGTVSTNPSQLALLSLAIASYSGQGSEGASMLVELEFEVVVFDRTIVASS